MAKEAIDYYEELCALVKQLKGDTEKLKRIYDDAESMLSEAKSSSKKALNDAQKINKAMEKNATALKEFNDYKLQIDGRLAAIEQELKAIKDYHINTVNEKHYEKPHRVDIQYNQKMKRIGLFFDSKPAEEVRNVLKENGFRWDGREQCWYATDNEKNESFAEEFSEQYNGEFDLEEMTDGELPF